MLSRARMSEFQRDTALEALNAGRFRARLHRRWWISRGANGGYLAALLTRALEAVAFGLPPRSITFHYAAAPEPGAVEIDTQVVRRGRSLSLLRAEMRQGERLIVTATGACAAEREGPRFRCREAPSAPPPEQCPRFEGFHDFHRRWEYRWVYGTPPGTPGEHPLAGGWIRPVEATPAEPAFVAAVCDAFSPPHFSTLPRDAIRPVPTVELTVHFRRADATSLVPPGDFLLARFESNHSAEGFVDEVGEVWTADGTLVAECRQLATFL